MYARYALNHCYNSDLYFLPKFLLFYILSDWLVTQCVIPVLSVRYRNAKYEN